MESRPDTGCTNIKPLDPNLNFDGHSMFQVAARQIQPPPGKTSNRGLFSIGRRRVESSSTSIECGLHLVASTFNSAEREHGEKWTDHTQGC
jgi:hypothetical protein